MKKYYFGLIAAILLLGGQGMPLSRAEEPPPSMLIVQANENANMGLQLVERARQILQGGVGKEKLQLAVSLYVEAGQSFEKAENLFRKAGTDYVSQEDIDGATRAKEECISAINELKKKLGGGPKTLHVPEPASANSKVLVS